MYKCDCRTQKLARVGVIRLGYPATASVLPYTAWPTDMVGKLSGNYALVHGGYEYDGQLLGQLDETEIKTLLEKWQDKVESIAVVGVFPLLKTIKSLRFAILYKKFMEKIFQFLVLH